MQGAWPRSLPPSLQGMELLCIEQICRSDDTRGVQEAGGAKMWASLSGRASSEGPVLEYVDPSLFEHREEEVVERVEFVDNAWVSIACSVRARAGPRRAHILCASDSLASDAQVRTTEHSIRSKVSPP